MTRFMSMLLVVAGATPAAGQVSNDDAARLLRERLGSSATLKGSWSVITGDTTATARVCADSGRTGARRLLAVCTSFADGAHTAPGSVELLVLKGPSGTERRARLAASLRGIESGSFGMPTGVTILELGPGLLAFAVDSGVTSMGWSTATRSLYAPQGDQLVLVMTVSTDLDNSGACQPGLPCAFEPVDLNCTLVPKRSRDGEGFSALQLFVSGHRGGRAVKRSWLIPFHDGAYRLPEAVALEGCSPTP